jgi:hypothetical protein
MPRDKRRDSAGTGELRNRDRKKKRNTQRKECKKARRD